MPGVPVIFRTTYDQYPELAKREMKEAYRYGNWAMADVWRTTLRKDHFLPNARWMFGYQDRSKGWKDRKLKLAKKGIALEGGTMDLVFKGLARSQILETLPSIAAYPSRATVTIFAPKYITMRPRNPNRPNMGQEVTAVSSGHLRIITGRGDQALNQRARQIRAAKIVTIG